MHGVWREVGREACGDPEPRLMGPVPSVEGSTLTQPPTLLSLPSRSHVRPALVRPAASGQSARAMVGGCELWAGLAGWGE